MHLQKDDFFVIFPLLEELPMNTIISSPNEEDILHMHIDFPIGPRPCLVQGGHVPEMPPPPLDPPMGTVQDFENCTCLENHLHEVWTEILSEVFDLSGYNKPLYKRRTFMCFGSVFGKSREVGNAR